MTGLEISLTILSSLLTIALCCVCCNSNKKYTKNTNSEDVHNILYDNNNKVIKITNKKNLKKILDEEINASKVSDLIKQADIFIEHAEKNSLKINLLGDSSEYSESDIF